MASAAKAVLTKQDKSSEKDVDAPRQLLTRPIAVSLPYRPPRTGGGSEGPVVAAQIRNCSSCTG